MSSPVCRTCGQLHGNEEYDAALWNLYYRSGDYRVHAEPLVFTGDWLDEHIIDDEDAATLNYVMEKDMSRRGLCPTCGRPDLSRVDTSSAMSEEEFRDYCDMLAEQRAERLAGC